MAEQPDQAQSTLSAELDTPGISRREISDCRLLDGRVKLLQPAQGYRVAIDPVLLAAAVPARPGEKLLELGCGSGAASLCLLARVKGLEITGLELNLELAALARRNATVNGFKLSVMEGNLLIPPAELAADFDQIFMNPPYLSAGAATASQAATRAATNVESETTLKHWIDAALTRLACGGRLTLIHRAERLGEILALLHGRAGEARVLPLRALRDRPATRVIVTVRKNKRAPLLLLPDLVLHEASGGFSLAAEAVLRRGAALQLAP